MCRASTRRWPLALCAVAASLLAVLPLNAQSTSNPPSASTVDTAPYGADVPPLFETETPLEIRIEADFDQIRGDRSRENPEREGVVHVIDADGTESQWPVQVRTRGNFRLQARTCEFPPIRLNFPKKAVEGGVFEGQDKIKLVTHCRDRYESNVLREYLVYRMYNHLTPASFRVRLARVTYVDTAGEEEPLTRLAFFIEMEESLGDRLGGHVMEDDELTDGVHPARILGPEALRVDLFAFMVGNTDYTMYFPSENGGLHNIVAVQQESGLVTPVPYDFDWTGLVDALYARPNPEMGISEVTDRIFRGFCRPGLDYQTAYLDFLAVRPGIDRYIAEFDLMPEDDRRSVTRYLDEFWERIEDTSSARRGIEGACRRYG